MLTGLSVNAGVYEGTARLVDDAADFGRIKQGDVLVTRMTSPYFNVVLPMLGAIVTDRGGQLCHAAIVAREYGIPGIVGTRDATATIPDGARVRVDGTTGEVRLLGVSEGRHPGALAALETAVDEAVFGGKAAQLGAALAAGLPVPGGFALGWEAVRRGDRRRGRPRSAAASAGCRARGRCGRARSARTPPARRFAGTHLSVLGVVGAASRAGRRASRCTTPPTTRRRIAYRDQHGLDPTPRMAVVAPADGRLRRRGRAVHPQPGHRRATSGVIEASWGLGETVVSGLVTPDQYRLSPDGGRAGAHHR